MQWRGKVQEAGRRGAGGSVVKSLPCKKMICTGVCTYSSRCRYIHDARVMAPASIRGRGTCRKKDRESDESVDQRDIFFWPPVAPPVQHPTSGSSGNNTNYNGTYSVSSTTSTAISGYEAVASLWHHFVMMCEKVKEIQTDTHHRSKDDNRRLMNPVTRRPRLSVFVKLAEDQQQRLNHEYQKADEERGQFSQRFVERTASLRGSPRFIAASESTFSAPRPPTFTPTSNSPQRNNRKCFEGIPSQRREKILMYMTDVRRDNAASTTKFALLPTTNHNRPCEPLLESPKSVTTVTD